MGASTNITEYYDLNEFGIVNGISYPLTTYNELGYLYGRKFFKDFVFFGKKNKIIGTLEAGASSTQIDFMLKRSMASFYDLYLKKETDRILLSQSVTEISLDEYFSIGSGSDIEISVTYNSNSNVADAQISGNNLVLSRKPVNGFSDVIITANIKNSDIYIQTELKVINPTTLVDDFEIPDLADSAVPWINSGSADWYIDPNVSYFNSSSLRSGLVQPGQNSAVSIQLDLAEPGTLIFAYKTSTRPFYDRLLFTIDSVDIWSNESIDLWSGINDWRLMSTSVRAGKRNLSWDYIRGFYTAYNQDAVWIDMVILPDSWNSKKTSDQFAHETSLKSYPNPFNPVTQISFELPDNGPAELMIFDVTGRLVEELHKGMLEKGAHSFLFDGSRLSSGIYYSVLRYGDKIATNKLVLTK